MEVEVQLSEELVRWLASIVNRLPWLKVWMTHVFRCFRRGKQIYDLLELLTRHFNSRRGGGLTRDKCQDVEIKIVNMLTTLLVCTDVDIKF